MDRFPVNEVNQKIKKRKLQAEQLGLPITKHKCRDQKFPSEEPVSMFDNPDQNLQTQKIKGKGEAAALNDGFEPESAEGSNSFAGDTCDSAMSVYSEAELKPTYAKTQPRYRASISSVKNTVINTNNNLDSMTLLEASYNPDELEFGEGGVHQSIQHVEDQLQDFGEQASYICSEYGDHFISEHTEEAEDIIYSRGGLNQNTYILSSGRWTIDQEVNSGGSRKPTIDQEFEQYFSSLML